MIRLRTAWLIFVAVVIAIVLGLVLYAPSAAQGDSTTTDAAPASTPTATETALRHELVIERRAFKRDLAGFRGGFTPAVSRAVGRALAEAHGWRGAQFVCLDRVVGRESRWRLWALNPSSGAFGIPQSLPGGKMASAGSEWRTNPVPQVLWMLRYIAGRYGTPCGALAHSLSSGWY